MHVLNVVKNGNRIAYYECLDSQGRQGKLTKEQLIEEIEAGRCDNAKLQIYYGSKIIRLTKGTPKTVNKSLRNDKEQVTKKVQPNTNPIHKEQNDIQQNNFQNLVNFGSGLNIQEIDSSVVVGSQAIDKLKELDVGLPLLVKSSEYSEFEQVIYVGVKTVQSREAFTFFNGDGISGCFALSEKFIANNIKSVQFKFNDNDPNKVAELLSKIKELKNTEI